MIGYGVNHSPGYNPAPIRLLRMMGSPRPPDFDAVVAALAQAGILADAAEIHGHLSGMVCLLGAAAPGAWLAQVLADSGSPAGQSAAVLERKAADTCATLEAGDMSFAPLLPRDERPLAERAECLAHWCQGFMRGLGVAVEAEPEMVLQSDTAKEIIEDFSEISRAMYGSEETETEAEAAYAELVEYVRVSVQFIFEDLHPARRDDRKTAVH